MTDNSELKRLAEHHLSLGQAYTVAKPSVLLALIAENERLHESDQEATELCDTLSVLLGEIAVAVRGPEEPKSRHGFHDLPSRVKTVVSERDQLKADNESARKHWQNESNNVQALMAEVLRLKAENERQAAQFKEWQASHHANYVAAAGERDQLRAEVSGLKTGYEAYERVNAELKAEVELLRSLLGQSALAATTLRTDAEAYANHSGFNRGFVDFIRSISGVEVGHGYGSSKYPQQADVVAALGHGEQS